eukprot:gene869-biopygen22691
MGPALASTNVSLGCDSFPSASWAAEPREWLGAIVRAPRIGFLPRNSVRAFAIQAMKWYARRHSRDSAPVPYASADKAAQAPPAFTAFCEGSTKGPWISRSMLEQRPHSCRREATAERRRAACEAATKDAAAVVDGWSCRVLGVQKDSARKRYETNPGEMHRIRCSRVEGQLVQDGTCRFPVDPRRARHRGCVRLFEPPAVPVRSEEIHPCTVRHGWTPSGTRR